MSANLGDAISAHYREIRDRDRHAIAAELRAFEPDPALEAAAEHLALARATGERVPRSLSRIAADVSAYQERKLHAHVFNQTGVLPDGKPLTTGEGPDAV